MILPRRIRPLRLGSPTTRANPRRAGQRPSRQSRKDPSWTPNGSARRCLAARAGRRCRAFLDFHRATLAHEVCGPHRRAAALTRRPRLNAVAARPGPAPGRGGACLVPPRCSTARTSRCSFRTGLRGPRLRRRTAPTATRRSTPWRGRGRAARAHRAAAPIARRRPAPAPARTVSLRWCLRPPDRGVRPAQRPRRPAPRAHRRRRRRLTPTPRARPVSEGRRGPVGRGA